MNDTHTKLYKVAKVEPEVFENLERDMEEITGKSGIVAEMEKDMDEHIQKRLDALNLTWDSPVEELLEKLTKKIEKDEDELYKYIGITRDDLSTYEGAIAATDKLKSTAKNMATEHGGKFLKYEKAEEILRKHPPKGALELLNYKDVEELLKKEDLMEIMSALRFTETEEWMHEGFDVAYSDFTPEDFEERAIELKVLGPQWKEVAKKYVAKKHHNVSHLKEFGVIFLNPIQEHLKGSLMRDFTLFLHYFHEIVFYSRLFQHHYEDKNFAEKLKSFLRGDVAEKTSVEKGEWLIVQRYLWKVDPNDPRLFMPRVNPESLHWRKGEDDAVAFGERLEEVGLEFWKDSDWVAAFFTNKAGERQFTSFDLEDRTFSLAAQSEGRPENFNYHQQEALWNELFRRYMGAEKRYQLMIENFEEGIIDLKKELK
ncbi:MAG: hypothetical protein R3251_03915 [Candidatus Spechtbacterales bacterium]|nr:hypothetical protein [Candidatus Spechtbacterales bacterium]